MIRVLLNGCNGRMGKVITQISSNYSDLSIVAGIDSKKEAAPFKVFSSLEDCDAEADIIVDFSSPAALSSLLHYTKTHNCALVLCTTGYSKEDIIKIEEYSRDIPIFRSANMSIGINVVNKLLKDISAFLFKDFDIEIIEKHHNQKLDAPSGTALLLANTIKSSLPEETLFVHGREGISKRHHKEIGIHAVRGGSIVGEHQVIFAGLGETIEIKHSALSREVFAAGAIKACEFMYKKPAGLYSMENMLE